MRLNSEGTSELASHAEPRGEWPTPWQDVIISWAMILLSVVAGGLGLYLMTISWRSFPLIVIGLTAWGVACLGVRRLISGKK